MLLTNPIYRSLYKPVLFVGCERLPFTLIVAIAGGVIMAYQSLLVTMIVFMIYIVLIILIRRVNERDPQYFKCLYRYLRYYQDYYPANAFYPGLIDKPLSKFE